MADHKYAAVDSTTASRFFIHAGDLLACRFNGSRGNVGRVARVASEPSVPTLYPDKLIRLRPLFDDASYLQIVLNAAQCRRQIEGLATTTAGNLGINGGQLKSVTVALPPLAEQRRIVERVDELMALIDRFEAVRDRRDTLRRATRDAALAALRDAESAEAAQAAWARIAAAMGSLFAEPEDVAPLRQAVLQLAVRGRLVRQDRLGRSDARTTKAPFSVPATWIWGPLARCTSLITDGEHQTPSRDSRGSVPLATAKNVRDGFIDLRVTDFVTTDVAGRCWQRCRPTQGDVLLVCVGATTGRCAVLWDDREMVLVRSVALIRADPGVMDPEFLATVLRSPFGQTQIWANVKQSAQPCLYLNRIRALTTPVPPLAEQRRIVSKVEELMGICDRLEERLRAAREARVRFSAAAVATPAGAA